MVQFSYSYMTTGKTIALTVWTLVSKVVSLGWFREWIKYEVWEGLLEEVCLNWELKGENDNNSGDDWKEFPGEFSCSKREWEAFEELKEDWHGVHRKRRVQSESGEEGKTEFSGSCEPSCEVVLILNAVELERGGYQRAERHFEGSQDASLPLPIWYQNGLTKQWKSGKLILQGKGFACISPDGSKELTWLPLWKIQTKGAPDIQNRDKTTKNRGGRNSNTAMAVWRSPESTALDDINLMISLLGDK